MMAAHEELGARVLPLAHICWGGRCRTPQLSTRASETRLETSAWTPSSSHSRLSRPSPHTPHANKGPCSSQPESRNLGCSPAALVSSHQLGSAPTAALMRPRGKREPSLPCTSSAPTGLSAQSAFHLELSVSVSPTQPLPSVL